jgi:hypothetical protein
MYFVIVGPAMLLAAWASFKVKSTFSKWSRVGNAAGMTGAQAARAMLDAGGLQSVGVERVGGYLSDHYDPGPRVLRLSPDVHDGVSVAALGVACHEAGHAFQHAQKYPWLEMRSRIVPVAKFGSWLAWPMIIGGMMLSMMNLALIGLILFGCLVVFQIVTLPVEFDASNRAKEQLQTMGILRSAKEVTGVNQVLNAAAMTYVAATVVALAQVLYFAYRMGLLGNRR